MDAPLDVDDAVAGAERLMRSTDVVQCGGHLLVVLWMFMGQHHAGCWFRGAGFIAVQSFDFGSPFPPLVLEVQPEPPGGMRLASGQCLRELSVLVMPADHDQKP